jgi:pyridoxamine 5'-phosphate oxidase
MGIDDRRIEYETAGLDLPDVAADPIAQWWRWYDEAVAAEVTEPNAMTLATVDADGRPDARMVLVRGVDERGFAFYTNLTSAKSEQLEANPVAAVVFGWIELHRQVRARGAIERVSDGEADAYFTNRPRGSQIGAWASPQSEPLADRRALEALVAETEERFAGVDVSRPPYWGGWRLVPDVIEFWQGRPSRLHDRLQYARRADAWVIRRLAP